MAGFNVCCRVYQFAACICIAVTTGFIPPASYAHASNNDKRYLRLSLHATWINFAWSIFVTILALTIPKQISLIFGSGDEYIDYAVPILRNSNYLGFLRWVQFNCQAMLQALQHGVHAMIVSLMSNFVGFLVFAYVLFYTDKHNVKRLMYLYTCTTGFGSVVGIALLISPLWKLYKDSKQQLQAKQANIDIDEDYQKMEKTSNKDTSNSDYDNSMNESSTTNINQTKESDENTDTHEASNVNEI